MAPSITEISLLDAFSIKSFLVFFTSEKLVYMMSVRPREIFGIEGGRIEPGAPADLALIDIDREWTVDPKRFVTLGRATPFEGWRVQGENLLTVLRGEIVYEGI